METTIEKAETLHDVLEAIKGNPEIEPFARVVGRWVWCEFPERPSSDVRDTLKALGFRWNRKREAWQHNCGRFCGKSKTNPRWKYGEVPIGEYSEESAPVIF